MVVMYDDILDLSELVRVLKENAMNKYFIEEYKKSSPLLKKEAEVITFFLNLRHKIAWIKDESDDNIINIYGNELLSIESELRLILNEIRKKSSIADNEINEIISMMKAISDRIKRK